MSIDRVNISSQGIDRAQLTQPNELVRGIGKDREASLGSDSVAFSSKAKELEQLAGAVDQSRIERYNAVLDALKSGTYDVSAAEIAQKLIEAYKKL